MEWLGNFLNAQWLKLVELVSVYWQAFVDFLTYLPVQLLDTFLTALADIVEAIPVPAFIESGLGVLFSGLEGGVLWFATQLQIPLALSLIGAGFLFRITRKLLTLGQW